MTVWFHTTILATCVAATAAVGLASAAMYSDMTNTVAPKADRLPIAASADASKQFMTVETRSDGVSVLSRVPVQTVASN